jgi:hypothetical protein
MNRADYSTQCKPSLDRSRGTGNLANVSPIIVNPSRRQPDRLALALSGELNLESPSIVVVLAEKPLYLRQEKIG